MTKILGVVPARGGSKGVPRKNLRKLVGRPLISYVVKEALKADLLDRVVVSTDDKEIAKVARYYGAETPFVRPPELAKDEVSLIPVVQHAARFLAEKEDWEADVVVSLQPTSPFISANDIDSAIKKLTETGCDSVVTVCKITHGHPYQALKLENDKPTLLNPDGLNFLQKQDLPPMYRINGALYVRKRETIEKWNGQDYCLGEDVRAVVMDEIDSIDIDTPLDFLLAETVMKKFDCKDRLKFPHALTS